jgi:hypothetical protein
MAKASSAGGRGGGGGGGGGEGEGGRKGGHKRGGGGAGRASKGEVPTVAATVRGEGPEAAEAAPPPVLPAPVRVERGVGTLLPGRVERGVPALRPGLCKKDDGLMPTAERVERGLLPRVDCGSSPKKPPTMSSSAPKVGVCSIGELAENIDGVRPVPFDSSRSKLPRPPAEAELGTRLEAPPAPPAPRLRVDEEPAPRALSGWALADRLGSWSSPRCLGARPDPRLSGSLRFVMSMADKPWPRADDRVVEGGPSRSFIHGDANDMGPGLTPTPKPPSYAQHQVGGVCHMSAWQAPGNAHNARQRSTGHGLTTHQQARQHRMPGKLPDGRGTRRPGSW